LEVNSSLFKTSNNDILTLPALAWLGILQRAEELETILQGAMNLTILQKEIFLENPYPYNVTTVPPSTGP